MMQMTRPVTTWQSSGEGPTVSMIIRGRIDTRTAADLRLALHQAIDSATDFVVLDLAEAEIGDATGLGLLVECHRRARRRGHRLQITKMTPRTRRLLLGIRLDRHLLSA